MRSRQPWLSTGVLILALSVITSAVPQPRQEAPGKRTSVQAESNPQVPTQEQLNVLLITGANNHDWEFTSPLLKRVLESTGRFQVTITSNPSLTLAEEDLQQYDLFFLDYNGARWGPRAERRFDAAVKSGVGVVVMHAANNAFPGWIDFETLVGHCWRKGTGHGRFHKFDIAMINRDHPIMGGHQYGYVPDFRAHPDELYHRLEHMHGADHEVLAHAYSNPSTGGTGRLEPIVTVLRHGKGRVFHTPLGHVWRNQPETQASVEDPQFQTLIARGAEWAGSGTVTLKAPWREKKTSMNKRGHHLVMPFGDSARARFILGQCETWLVYSLTDGRLLANYPPLSQFEKLVYETPTGMKAVFTTQPRFWAGKVRIESNGSAPGRRNLTVTTRTTRNSLSITHKSAEATLTETVMASLRLPSEPAGQGEFVRSFKVRGLKPGERFIVPAAPYPRVRQSIQGNDIKRLTVGTPSNYSWDAAGNLRFENGTFEWRLLP